MYFFYFPQQYEVYIESTDIISCDEMRPFWVSWDGGIIKVGHGDLIDRNTFLEWPDPEPRGVTYAAYSTYVDTSGEWEVTMLRGRLFGFYQSGSRRLD